jgi:hypothetical protein
VTIPAKSSFLLLPRISVYSKPLASEIREKCIITFNSPITGKRYAIHAVLKYGIIANEKIKPEKRFRWKFIRACINGDIERCHTYSRCVYSALEEVLFVELPPTPSKPKYLAD